MKNSISFRFIVIVSGITFVLFAVLTLVLILVVNNTQNTQSSAFIESLKNEKISKEELLQQTLQRKGESIIRLLSQNGSPLILGYDFETLEVLAQSGALDAEITFVTFYDVNNQALTTEPDQISGNTIKQQIVFENEALGHVRVGIDDIFVKDSNEESAKSLEKTIANTTEAKNRGRLFMIIVVSVFSIVGLVGLCVAIFVLLMRVVIKPINNVISLAEKISEGDLTSENSSSEIDNTKNDEINRLFIAMDKMVVALKKKVYLAEQIAKGDLSVEVTLASENDTLGKALQNMTSKLGNVFNQIDRITDDVSTGSIEVSTSSQVISQGATQQASSLEEVTSTANDVGSQARINAENASKASELVIKALDSTQKGDNQMNEMVSAIGK